MGILAAHHNQRIPTMDQAQLDNMAIENLILLIYAFLPECEDELPRDNKHLLKSCLKYIDMYCLPDENSIRVVGSNGASDLIITVSVVE
jgi:hypothetical protein